MEDLPTAGPVESLNIDHGELHIAVDDVEVGLRARTSGRSSRSNRPACHRYLNRRAEHLSMPGKSGA
jgi:hypothetical protein